MFRAKFFLSILIMEAKLKYPVYLTQPKLYSLDTIITNK